MNTPRVDSDRAFIITAVLAFVVSAAVTVIWSMSRSGRPGMEMPGDWTMSMTWMRMPGQTWTGAAATFIGMWVVMMVAMMLPVLAPMLARYRRAVAGARRRTSLTATVAVAYYLVWALAGIVVYPLGILFGELAMQAPQVSRAVPLAGGVVVVIAGLLQFTTWKARLLACCRDAGACGSARPNYRAAWSCGLRFGARCVGCCAGLNAILLITGVMDLLAMALVMMAISAERLTKAGEGVARATGLVVMGIGVSVISARI